MRQRASLSVISRNGCMDFLEVDGAQIAFRVLGSGPPLVAPECNYAWTPTVEAQLAEQFTLIVPSPRDYGLSTRTGGPRYTVASWATDVQAVAAHLGYDRFLFFGYSFTGAFGPWLARQLRGADTVVAVASGGFPLIGDYRVTLADVEEQAGELQRDPALFQQVMRDRFDPLAAREFYRDLATLPPDALVDDLPCPLYCFWGDRDTDAVEVVLSHQQYMTSLRKRGVPFDLHQGYDHEGLNAELEVALPGAMQWLREQADKHL